MAKVTEADVDTLLPLNPRVYAILMVIAEGPCHGYRIKREVEELSNGSIELDPGSLYRAIAKLVRDGMIEEFPAPPHSVSEDARRRYYGLTDLGRRVAQAETRRLGSLMTTDIARSFLRGEH